MVWPAIDWLAAITRGLAHVGLGVLLSTLLYWFLEKIFLYRDEREGFRQATWVGVWGGIFSVIIDVDHIVMWWGATYTRPLHWPAFYVAIVFASLLGLNYLLSWLADVGSVNMVKKSIWWFIWCVCVIVHVIEDFTLNRF